MLTKPGRHGRLHRGGGTFNLPGTLKQGAIAGRTITAREQCKARCAAGRCLDIVTHKETPFAGQLVDVGGPNVGLAKTGQFRAQVINTQQQHIRSFSLGLTGPLCHTTTGCCHAQHHQQSTLGHRFLHHDQCQKRQFKQNLGGRPSRQPPAPRTVYDTCQRPVHWPVH